MLDYFQIIMTGAAAAFVTYSVSYMLDKRKARAKKLDEIRDIESAVIDFDELQQEDISKDSILCPKYSRNTKLAMQGMCIIASGLGAFMNYDKTGNFILAGACIAIGFALAVRIPETLEKNKEQKARKKLASEVPYLIDSIEACLDTGSVVTDALSRSANALDKKSPIRRVIKWVISSSELRPLSVCMKEAADIVNIESFSSLASLIISGSETGSSFDTQLEELGKTIRSQRKLELEKEANKLETIILIPIGTMIFPALLLTALAPTGAMIASMFTTISGTF